MNLYAHLKDEFNRLHSLHSYVTLWDEMCEILSFSVLLLNLSEKYKYVDVCIIYTI